MKSSRPLPILRAQIDAIDREILYNLSRRFALVTEVGEFKRKDQRPVRDSTREREVLDGHARRAAELGLPKGLAESVFRLVMWAARDHQAALGVALSAEDRPQTVAVIGAKGGMGKLFTRLFKDFGHALLSVDVDTPLGAAEAASLADVVVIAVPINDTEAVIREVGPHIKQESLLMDLTSVKTGPMQAMLASTKASVLGTHPMFGPRVHSLQGQRIAICPGRGEAWQRWAERLFVARGLSLATATAEEHDRIMAVVQVLNHFHTQVLGLTLAKLGRPLEETLRFSSPAYLLELYVTARHFNQDSALYGPIEMNNPQIGEMTEALTAAAAELGEILRAQDAARFEALFQEVRDYFGDFAEEAQEQSGFLIDRLVERS